jgi:hypothetical protein
MPSRGDIIELYILMRWERLRGLASIGLVAWAVHLMHDMNALTKHSNSYPSLVTLDQKIQRARIHLCRYVMGTSI